MAQVDGAGWTVGGMAKGAGMLAPALATMLCVLTTDADVDPSTLDGALRAATGMTFDRVDADGCLSTNDTVLLLASGASGHRPDPDKFAAAVQEVCQQLVMALLADVEGSTKRIGISVDDAATEKEAVEVGRAVARSALLKCALYGNDPNWGRVLAAVGTTGATFDPDALDVSINGVQVCRSGAAGDDRGLVDLSGQDIDIRIGLHAGAAQATVWTTDLTEGYVRENSAYPS
jgi:glutamate N-acetyltransferase/amino-acid N-acetyltransferase